MFFEKVRDIIAKQLDIDAGTITMNSRLIDDLPGHTAWAQQQNKCRNGRLDNSKTSSSGFWNMLVTPRPSGPCDQAEAAARSRCVLGEDSGPS